MRFLKIILIIFSIVIILAIAFILLAELNSLPKETPLEAIIYIVLMMVLSVINILYHVKSFRFYRREEKRNLDKKISKFLWIGVSCFYAFLLFLLGQGMYNNWRRYWYGNYKSEDIFFVTLFLFPALIGFMEVFFLKKRIKQLKAIRNTKEEINDIGTPDS